MSDYSDLITGTPGLVAYWRFGEASGNALDSSGNGHTGTVSNAAYGVTGLIDGDPDTAFDFNGTNANVSFGDILDFERTDSFTIELRLVADLFGGGGPDRSVIGKVDVAGNDRGWEFRLVTHTLPRFRLLSGIGSGLDVQSAGVVISNNAATTVHVTYDGSSSPSGVKIYINGVAIATSTVQNNLTTTTVNAASLKVGSRSDDNFWWSGVLDEVAVYNVVLDAATCLAHHNFAVGDHGPPPADLPQPVNLILDMDICTDVGDVPTVPCAVSLERQGECVILGYIVTSGNDYSASCLEALSNFCQHPTPVIGTYKGGTALSFSSFTQPVTDAFNPGKNINSYPDALVVYRTLLRDAPDASVVINTSGTGESLSELVSSPADGIDSRTGLQLITDKVARLVVMGGDYPFSSGPEFNLGESIGAWVNVLTNWPTAIDIVFEGASTGSAVSIFVPVGSTPGWDPATNPIRLAFDNWSGGVDQQYAWDQLVILYAVRGTNSGMGFGGVNGTNTVNPIDGNNAWTQLPDSKHHYLDFSTELPSVIESELNTIFLASLPIPTAGSLPLIDGGLIDGGVVNGGLVY